MAETDFVNKRRPDRPKAARFVACVQEGGFGVFVHKVGFFRVPRLRESGAGAVWCPPLVSVLCETSPPFGGLVGFEF